MKRVGLILTGGTFGMLNIEEKSILKATELEGKLNHLVPEITQLANIKVISKFSIDSSNIQPHHWCTLAEIVEQNIIDFDGFVIVHGTDTMAYTASALSFMFINLTVPVVLTGAQRPLSEIRSDARMNLLNAIEMAKRDIPEVSICFDYQLFRGNRAKKVRISDFDAFESPNFQPLAQIGIDIKEAKNILRPNGLFQVMKRFNTSVISIPIFPGIQSSDLSFLVKSNVKGVLFEVFGAGNVPILENSFLPIIEGLTQAGKLVVLKSQCIYGEMKTRAYEGGKKALEAGAISCHDMTRDAAIVKLMFLFGNMKNLVSVKENFMRSLAGERTI